MRIIVLSCMLLGASYGFSQSKVAVKPESTRLRAVRVEQKVDYGVVGIVHTSGRNNCDTWIEVNDYGRKLRLVPMNLPDGEKVEGRQITFDYGIIDQAQNQACPGKGVYVQNVRALNPREERM
jgi:hypothetical protein